MRFLVEAQLPPALARWLTEAGFDAEHVGDCGMQGAPDSAIWDRAMRTQAAIVTKDEDFARRRAMSDTGPSVVWIRLRNTRRWVLLAWFEAALPRILAALESGETLIEVV